MDCYTRHVVRTQISQLRVTKGDYKIEQRMHIGDASVQKKVTSFRRMVMNIHVSNTSERISCNSVQGVFVLESQLQAQFPSINHILHYLNSSRRFQNPSG